MYGCQEKDVAHYTCYRISEPLSIDGNLQKKPWLHAPKGTLVDLVTGEKAPLETKIATLWDNEYLYVAFCVEEPDIQATLTERDSLVYSENDIELFIAGEDCYYEFQINALGTIYEVFFIWQEAYTKESRFYTPEFNLLTKKIDVLGGFQDVLRYEKHPRGKRWAFMDWDFPGLKTAVTVQGTINDSSDIDQGWMVELAFPWKGMKSLFGKNIEPRDTTTLRINFSRFEVRMENKNSENNPPGWSLNAHGVYDSHIPNCFSIVHLSSKDLKTLK
ncbi:MAG: carbohydrate-binding family 9-like protein [Candidatus Heimdallarchaeota archaeon]